MWTTDDNHGAQVQFHSGRHMLDPHEPTLGAWVTYGLASMTDNLPTFVNMGPRFFDVRDGHYLGPAYDAVNLRVDPKNPLAFAAPEIPLDARGAGRRVRARESAQPPHRRRSIPATRRCSRASRATNSPSTCSRPCPRR